MAATQDLAALLADLTARQRQIEPSRNRPITLSVVNAEEVALSDAFTSTTFSPPFYWYDGSTGSYPELVWGESEWS